MIYFFGEQNKSIFAVESQKVLLKKDIEKLHWLFENKPLINSKSLTGTFIGPRRTMLTPWSTNAIEILNNMGVNHVTRIEEFFHSTNVENFDSMLQEKVFNLDQNLFKTNIEPKPIIEIENISIFNTEEGLSLSNDEIKYLENLEKKLSRKLTDSEVFGFSQVNSEHCRHKIFNGQFRIDGKIMSKSLFQLIKNTSKINPNEIVSAYKDNVAFIDGPIIEQFAPRKGESASIYTKNEINSVISLKAETHNFPTTVEPFNGAATGSGGEIRDRMAGGLGSIPLAGTAVYMTPYSRINNKKEWEKKIKERKWKYQSPLDILIKASNGASDFGNKFGQPLIAGSLFTFEHNENEKKISYDKVIMLAGGIGYANAKHAQKIKPKIGDVIIVLGGDNYRIGMGGAAVSSANTGSFNAGIELNAIQRSNPEMQKRVANAIRSLCEKSNNPIISIHDHGAGGHLNCLSELVEETGGEIFIDKLPLGDPTLSDKEIIGNESQERMGLIISKNDINKLKEICKRERAPIHVVGNITDNNQFTFINNNSNKNPIDLSLNALFGNSPKTLINDNSIKRVYEKVSLSGNPKIHLEKILLLESVACKDWLTNKVDRCVTGRVAQQQTVGSIQLPLSNCGVVALDYSGINGIATSIGHSPITGLIDPSIGSINSVAKALTNIVFAPLKKNLKSVSLSANWMWPCNNPGEDSRLYSAVKSCSKFAEELGINIPTGKDSLSMKQKYENESVLAPGTVIISAVGHCSNINQIVTPEIKGKTGKLFYVDFSLDNNHLGGTAFAQIQNKIGKNVSTVKNSKYFKISFNAVQKAIKNQIISAGHDISSGGFLTTLIEMFFPTPNSGAEINIPSEGDINSDLFFEKPGIIIQSDYDLESLFKSQKVKCFKLGDVNSSGYLTLNHKDVKMDLEIDYYRDLWYRTSADLDSYQTQNNLSVERFKNYKNQPLEYTFPKSFSGVFAPKLKNTKIKAAVIREKGSNSEREMAYAMQIAGFEVTDIHMTDLITGYSNLSEFKFIVAVGGFSNSDVLGSAKGWAGSFIYNKKAKDSLTNFFNRKDTLSLGVCNGCQLFIELGLITPEIKDKPKMIHNESGKFECIFTAVDILPSSSIFLNGIVGSKLGIWAAHGEGRFYLPGPKSQYQIPATYHFDSYPANPNGSDYNAAMLSSKDGRHLVMMPHLERSTFPWNWAYYPYERKKDKISPWIKVFENAYDWLKNK
ncbi:MAG: phosphoribosylformylglycinamidine synthase [Flavobacteriaceae bacterium]|nr:phosphoribosylformylglycinamidine synthase [Flavobacteriaceae bacterium]|tara:strand:- start:4263 stop:7910 length:3648 start_codon:yes stop_codon:yes gene_type:complete